MPNFKKYLLILLSTIASLISYIPAAIYAYVYSEFFTKVTYRSIGQRNKNKIGVKNVLDIGTATGGPLSTIVDYFSPSTRILGIDYNTHYVPACQKLFKEHPNVEIRHMNYYDLEKEEPQTLFDVIIFGSSFMILPDQTKALQIAKRKLSKNGSIYFLLTLYQNKNWLTRFLEFVKPYLKYLCTVDFGKATYKNEFEVFLKHHQLKQTFSQRCQGNFFLKLATFYLYQVQKC